MLLLPSLVCGDVQENFYCPIHNKSHYKATLCLLYSRNFCEQSVFFPFSRPTHYLSPHKNEMQSREQIRKKKKWMLVERNESQSENLFLFSMSFSCLVSFKHSSHNIVICWAQTCGVWGRTRVRRPSLIFSFAVWMKWRGVVKFKCFKRLVKITKHQIIRRYVSNKECSLIYT